MTETITIRRGDDERITINSILDAENNEYALQTGDYMVLTVRETPSESSEVLLKVTSTTMAFNLSHDVTAQLPAGKYSCDIELFILQAGGGYMHKTVFPDDEYIAAYGKTGGEKNWKNFIVNAEVGV